jgi:hypothetical protein
MPCLPLDQFDRCCSCKATRYNDLGEHHETMDGYLCSHCYRLAWGKRQPNEGELKAFMDDPDRYLTPRTDAIQQAGLAILNELVRYRELARELECENAQLKETILKMIEADAR